MEQNTENKKLEKWLYLGSYILTGGKVGQGFEVLDENEQRTGEECFYNLKKSYVIGGVYQISVERNGDKKTIYHKDFQYLKPFNDNAFILTLKARQYAFEQKEKARKMEAKAREKPIPETWEEIVFMHSQLKPDEAEFFIDYVVRRLRADSRILKYKGK